MFGSNGNVDPPPDGTAMTAYLWTSVSNNPNPTVDATVVSTVPGTIQSSHTDTLINFALRIPIELNVDNTFFAGLQSTG